MADRRISQLTQVVQIATGDLLVLVDVSDPTQAASGTTKYAEAFQLAELLLTEDFLKGTGTEFQIPVYNASNELPGSSTLTYDGTTLTVGTFTIPANATPVAGTDAITLDYFNANNTGGGGTWGSITGTLSDQTDLQAALDTKVNFTDAETITGLKTFAANTAGGFLQYDIEIGDTVTPDYGVARIGDASIGRVSYNVGGLDLDGAFAFRNAGGPVTGDIEFLFADSTDSVRFALPKSGTGFATYNPRSMIIAGPAPTDDAMVTVAYWQAQGIFDNLTMNTGVNGADLGVQHDLEVEGQIWVDTITESTTGAGVSFLTDIDVAGDITLTGTVDGIDIATDVAANTAKVSFPGFTSLLVDYGFTDNSANWDVAYNDRIALASFDTGTGVLTLTQQDAGTVIVDLDGRYAETVTVGEGLDITGTIDYDITLNFNELTDATGGMLGTDQFIILDGTIESRKAANEIGISIFNNDAGYTTNDGDITAVTAGNGLSGGGTSGDVTLTVGAGALIDVNATTVDVDLSELVDMTANMTSSDEFVVLDSSLQRRKRAAEIGLSIFNNDANYGQGDITQIIAGTNLNGGGSTGTVTINLDDQLANIDSIVWDTALSTNFMDLGLSNQGSIDEVWGMNPQTPSPALQFFYRWDEWRIDNARIATTVDLADKVDIAGDTMTGSLIIGSTTNVGNKLQVFSDTAAWGSQGGVQFANAANQSSYMWMDDANELNIQNGSAANRSLNLKVDRVDIGAGSTSGDRGINIYADTDNNAEGDHPYVAFYQDGGAIGWRLGPGETLGDAGAVTNDAFYIDGTIGTGTPTDIFTNTAYGRRRVLTDEDGAGSNGIDNLQQYYQSTVKSSGLVLQGSISGTYTMGSHNYSYARIGQMVIFYINLNNINGSAPTGNLQLDISGSELPPPYTADKFVFNTYGVFANAVHYSIQCFNQTTTLWEWKYQTSLDTSNNAAVPAGDYTGSQDIFISGCYLSNSDNV